MDPALKGTVVTANRELLLVAIRNLHENAARHMPEPGLVSWTLQRNADALVVCVDDEGPGIPEDEIAMVTNRFFPRPQQERPRKRAWPVDRRSRLARQWREAGPAKPMRGTRPARKDRLADRTRQ
jgi:hypothetical protein